MQKIGPFDVIVVGSGITGLSTVYHLLRHGVQRLALAVTDAPSATASSLASGFVAGGQVDNFTRISHIHGADKAKQLWAFGDTAFQALIEHCARFGVSHQIKRRLRLITSEHELVEARKAVHEMNDAKIDAALAEPAARHLVGNLCGPRVLAVQDDGPHGGWVRVSDLLQSLEEKTKDVPRVAMVQALQPHSGRVHLQLANGQELKAEMVVLAAHLGIRALLPEMSEALVSIADQWSEYQLAAAIPEACQGVAFTVDNTYEWGVFSGTDKVHLGGGRYLRPMAGIEAKVPSAEAKITEHLRKQLEQTFRFAAGAKVIQTRAALDINPCDELPIIGPMFGNGRILIGTGYMGAGLSLGFFGGQCLADLIALGQSAALPRCLWPERLRSLEA